MKADRQDHRYWTVAAAAMAGWLLVATGCASMGKNECLSADWQTIGFEDGAKGYPASRIGRYRQDCAEYGVAPSAIQYRQGRAQGLSQWCTPHNGYRLGKGGGQYNGVCPSQLEPDFIQAIAAGRQIYVLDRDVKNQASGVDRLNRDLDRLDQDIAAVEDDLVRPGIGPGRRRALLDEIRMLEADREALLAEMVSKEQALEAVRMELQQAKASNPYR